MPAYAHPVTPPIPNRKRCKTRHSERTPARCKLARGHEGDCLFGSWSDGYRLYANLDLPLPKVVEHFSAEYLAALAQAGVGKPEPQDAKP